jgi:hypothetical protein
MFWNQIKILIRERIVYSNELFNYEDYSQKSKCDSRLIRNFLFMPNKLGSKSLVMEYFKFQRQRESTISDSPFSLCTSDKIIHNLNILSSHVENMQAVDRQVDIEPILLVYFQTFSNQKMGKDALSRVSKQFWKDLKMKYKELENLRFILSSIL